ncbi:hypothetical protein HMPREF0880_00274 [Yokenella regensburgei ATCC 43003]|nr:hypothetical protein HMPREF0880_00274 [Yokenella regensburgei ATCC 43003]
MKTLRKRNPLLNIMNHSPLLWLAESAVAWHTSIKEGGHK